MSGSHCTPHWGATIHFKPKKAKKVQFWTVTLVGTSVDCGTSGSYKVCYSEQLWYSSELVVRRPSSGESQVRRLVRPSLTIPVTLLGTYVEHPDLTLG